jgi:hypothetical protein
MERGEEYFYGLLADGFLTIPQVLGGSIVTALVRSDEMSLPIGI